MSLLHIISGGGTSGTGLLPGVTNLLNGALQGVSDLRDISNSLNLTSLSSALNTNSLLGNSLLDAVNGLLDANADTTVVEDLLSTLNGLLSNGQAPLAQGLIDTVNSLVDGNVSTTVIDDLTNTVNQLLSSGQTGLIDDLTNTVNSLLGAGQGNLVDDVIATVNSLLGGGQTTLIDDLTNTVNQLLGSGQTGLIDDLTNTVNSLLGAGQGNLVDDVIATVNSLLGGGQTTLIDDLTNTVNQLLGSGQTGLIDDLANTVNSLLGAGQGNLVDDVIATVNSLLGGGQTTLIDDLTNTVNQLLGSGQTGLIDDLTNTVNSLLGAGQGNLVDDVIATVNALLDGNASTTVINDLLVAVNQLLGSTNVNLIDDLLNNVNNILIGGGVVTDVVTVVDDLLGGTNLPVISVIASDAIAAEGGSNTGTFTFSRTGSTSQALTVVYTLAGTANNGSDFAQLSGSVTFAAGSSTATVTVSPINDSAVEGDETVILSLASNPSYSIAPGQASATVTIQGNDSPVVGLPVISVIASDAGAAENPLNTGVFTLVRSGNTTQSLTVAYTINGTAINGVDYQLLSGTATFAAGSNTATITLTPINDNIIEGNETVTITLLESPSAYTITPGLSSATITIADDDIPTGNGSGVPSVGVIASDPTASENLTDPGTFTFLRTGNLGQALTITYSVLGTASSGNDFQALSGSVTFAAGSSTATVILTPIDDNLLEGNEAVVLTINSGSSNYTVIDNLGSAVVTILDNEAAASNVPVITVIATEPSATEAGSPGTFLLTRTGIVDASLTINYTLSGTATAGLDFQALLGSVTFAAGSSTATVSINPLADNLIEGNETVIFTITPNNSYAIVPGLGSATVTISDASQGPGGESFRDYQDLVAELAATNGELGSWRDNLIPQPGRPGPDQAAIQSQRLYIGYYNRAADAGGQQFWVGRLTTNSDIGQASREFANLPEAQSLYPILANPAAASDQAIIAFANSVFRNVFNRDIDQAGANFYLQRFRELQNSPIQGRVGEIITQILDGAIGSDATILNQKVALANAYTDSLILSNTPYNPEFGQNGIFSTLEAGASTTEALNVAKIVGQGKAPFLDGTPSSDTLTSFGGPTIVNLGNDTVADQLIFTSPARGGDLVQLFRSQDILAIQSSGFAGAPLPTADPITNSVTSATNTANTILVDIRSNLNNANFNNVRFAFDLSSGSFLYDADGNFGSTSDQVTLAQLDGFATSGLNLTANNFDFVG